MKPKINKLLDPNLLMFFIILYNKTAQFRKEYVIFHHFFQRFQNKGHNWNIMYKSRARMKKVNYLGIKLRIKQYIMESIKEINNTVQVTIYRCQLCFHLNRSYKRALSDFPVFRSLFGAFRRTKDAHSLSFLMLVEVVA